MGIMDFLPCPPWEGPPFPRFMGIRWPWIEQQAVASKERQSLSLLRNLQLPPGPFSASTYDNEETWEFVDWRGRDRKITVKRHARRG